MSNTELQNELQAVQSASKSGKMQILGKLNGQSRSVTVEFFEGKVMKIRVGKDTGKEAAQLLSNISVDSFVFMESKRVESTPEANIPDTATLIKMIAGEHKGYSSEEIITSTALALQNDMGSGSQKLVKRVAAEFPPNVDPKLFLEKCSEAAADIVGKKHADKLFAPLMEKY